MTSAPPDFDLLDTTDAVAALCDDIRAAGLFGLDTEFVSEHTYHPQLGLVQIALPHRLVLVDAVSGADLRGLWDLVVDPDLPVVIHAADQESHFCWRATGALPGALFDVQLAAAFVGERYPSSYGNLVHARLHRRIEQGQTRTDWLRRPLAPAQLAYAAEDVRSLLALREELDARLADLDRRDWLAEEAGRRQEALLHDLTNLSWRRLGGIQGLGRLGLAAVREIYRWREGLAERRDQPRKRVLRDDLIVSVAASMPDSEAALRRLRGFERRSAADVRAVLAAVEDARRLPEADRPAPARRRRIPPQTRMLALLLEALLDSACAQHHVDPGLVGGASDLRDLIHWRLNGRSGPAPLLEQGWRASVGGDVLEAALAGRVSLRITDPHAARPFVVEPYTGPADGESSQRDASDRSS